MSLYCQEVLPHVSKIPIRGARVASWHAMRHTRTCDATSSPSVKKSRLFNRPFSLRLFIMRCLRVAPVQAKESDLFDHLDVGTGNDRLLLAVELNL